MKPHDALPDIHAERVELLDGDGQVQAVLGLGGALITVGGLEPNPSRVVGIGVRPDGNIVTVDYDAANQRCFAHTAIGGGYTLLGCGPGGSYRALITPTPYRPTGIWCVDQEGQGRCGLDLVAGTILVELADRARGFEVKGHEVPPPEGEEVGGLCLALWIKPEGTTSVRALGTAGQLLWQLREHLGGTYQASELSA
jgi:hypothetical protein